MSDTDKTESENKKIEEIALGFCSKFQPQLAPHAVGPGKTLINYKIHYFPCMGDKCTDSWCHIDQMCRHRCEHELGYHTETEEDKNSDGFVDTVNECDEGAMTI